MLTLSLHAQFDQLYYYKNKPEPKPHSEIPAPSGTDARN